MGVGLIVVHAVLDSEIALAQRAHARLAFFLGELVFYGRFRAGFDGG